MPDESQEPPSRLEQRLAQASQAAERLIGEAAAGGRPTAAGGRPTRPPPAGWQTAGQDGSTQRPSGDLEALLASIQAARELIPPEVVARLLAALRELLAAIRALIDWYLERLERSGEKAQEPPDVQDIPIR